MWHQMEVFQSFDRAQEVCLNSCKINSLWSVKLVPIPSCMHPCTCRSRGPFFFFGGVLPVSLARNPSMPLEESKLSLSGLFFGSCHEKKDADGDMQASSLAGSHEGMIQPTTLWTLPCGAMPLPVFSKTPVDSLLKT